MPNYIDTGNPLADGVSNIIRIIEAQRHNYDIREINAYDRQNVEVYPSISVFYESHTENTLSLGSKQSKINLTISIPIWVYLDKISPQFRSDLARDLIWGISEMVRGSVVLDGWCKRCEVVGSRVQPRLRYGVILGGGLISCVVEKIIHKDRE